MLTIEFNADSIISLTAGKHVQISQVITESMEKKITFYVYLSNKDLAPATLFAKATDCKFKVPDSDNVTALVPPQRTEELKLETQPGSIELTDKFTCTIVASSGPYGKVAKREVLIKPHRRCICNMHCQCVCLGGSLKCEPMEEKDFHAAGFRGSLPILTAKPPYRPWIADHPFLAMSAFFLFLLLIGLCKGLCGVMGHKSVSYYGLESRIFGKKRIKHYFEPKLKDMAVMYDKDGHPINPDTKKPTQVFSDEIIFLMNTFFMCMWPILKIIDCCAARKQRNKGGVVLSTDGDESSPQRGGTAEIGKRGPNYISPGEIETTPINKLDIRPLHRRLTARNVPKRPPRAGQAQDKTEPRAGQRESIQAGRSLRNTVSDTAMESEAYKSDPDLSIKNKEVAAWQKGTHKVQAVQK